MTWIVVAVLLSVPLIVAGLAGIGAGPEPYLKRLGAALLVLAQIALGLLVLWAFAEAIPSASPDD